MSVNEVLEAVRAMSPEERARVRALLDALPTEPMSLEEHAQRLLYEAGLLTETRPHGIYTARITLVELVSGRRPQCG